MASKTIFEGTISKEMMQRAKTRKHEKHMRTITNKEIESMSQDLLQAMTASREFEARKKEKAAEMAAEQKKIGGRVTELHTLLSTGYIEEEGNYHYFPDMDNMMMHIYFEDPNTGEGRLTRSRPLSRNEMQLDLHSMALNAENDQDTDEDVEEKEEDEELDVEEETEEDITK